MAINGGTIFINVLANVGPFRQQMVGLGSTMSKFGSSVSRAGVSLSRGLTLPIALAGGAAVKLALDYETAFVKIDAVTNASQEEIATWKEEVLDLAGKTARAPEELASALYTLASAGLDANEVFPALRASAKAAATGMGDVNTVARLVTSAMNAYHKEGLKAAQVTDILVAAIREGRAEPDEFGDAIGRIIPIATKAHVSFDEIAASLAAVSNIGLDVNEGVTAMRGLMKALIVPGTQAAETLKKIGISTIELRDMLAEEGLLGVMRTLEAETKDKFGKGWLDAMNKIIPNIRALTGGLGLTVQEAQKVQRIFDEVADSTGDADKAFQKTAKGPLFQFQQALTKLKIAAIEVGNILIPILLDVVGYIEDLVKWFGNLSDSTKEWVVKSLIAAALIGPFLRVLGSVILLFSGIYRAVSSVVGLTGKLLSFTAAAKGAQQLTLFGPGVGAAAGGAGFAGPIVAGLALVASAAIALKIAYDNSNEAVDKNVELLRQGALSGRTLIDTNKVLTENLRQQESAWNGAALAARGMGGGARTALADNQEALKRFTDGVRNMAKSFGVTGTAVSDVASIFKTSQGTTEKYRHTIAAMIGGLQEMGGKLRDVTVRQLRNLLAVGDTEGAYRLLNREITEQSRKWGEHTREVAKNAKAASDADHAQRLLAGGVKNAEQAIKQATTSAGKGSDDVKKLNDRLRETGQLHPKPKVTVDGGQAQGVLQGIRGQLETLTSHPYVVEVQAKEIPGSPIPSELIAMLTASLEELTEPWIIQVKAAEDEGIRFMTSQLSEATRTLEKLGTVAADVWGQDFPKAYDEDVKAFRQATQEKSKEFEKQLKDAQKGFDKLKDKVNEFKDAIRSGFTDSAGLISGALEGMSAAAESMKSLLENPEEFSGGLVSFDPTQYLSDTLAQNQAFAQKLAQLAAKGLAPSLLAELASQGQSALPLIDALLGGGQDLIKQFNETAKQLADFADVTADALGEEKFGGALKKARNSIERLRIQIDNFNERVARQVENFVQALQAKRVGENIEALIQSLNRALRQLGVNVPHAATGGIVTRPTLLMAGEKGPEAIIPLGSLAGNGGNVIVNLNVEGNAIYAKDLAAEVRDILLREKRYKSNLGLS